ASFSAAHADAPVSRIPVNIVSSLCIVVSFILNWAAQMYFCRSCGGQEEGGFVWKDAGDAGVEDDVGEGPRGRVRQRSRSADSDAPEMSNRGFASRQPDH
ncbi:MAG: hypothetical protein WCK55_13470, partial [Verrucomicrobiota bacterium]